MKKKVFFILGSLRIGGSERVYWTMSQFLNKTNYDVSLVILDSNDPFFSPEIKGVRVIHLNTIRASRSFFKLARLIKAEKPEAIFTTGGHINTLLVLVSLFVNIPVLIGREGSLVEVMEKFGNSVDRFSNFFLRLIYKRINVGICQSEEIRHSLIERYRIPGEKLKIIPNPVLPAITIKDTTPRREKRIIYVGRLSVEKGVFRLLDVFCSLPEDYTLTIVGTGPLMQALSEKVELLGLSSRIVFLGAVTDVLGQIAKHDVTVLTSFTEGFPNVAVESLSVGVPVVSYRVSGISAIIESGFNGYIIEQGDFQSYKKQIIATCSQIWDAYAIKESVNRKFGVDRIAEKYESLINAAGNMATKRSKQNSAPEVCQPEYES